MEDSVSAFECSLDMSRVAYVAPDVRHAAVLDKRQQHVEHSLFAAVKRVVTSTT
jgi:hypothetical protein